MSVELGPPKSVKTMPPPSSRKGVIASLDKTTVVADEELMKKAPAKFGFGIDEFLEEYPPLMKTLVDPKASLPTAGKIEKHRLQVLMKWAQEVREKVATFRWANEFEGKVLPLLEVIIDKLRRAFEEEVKKAMAETKVSKTKVYDFGLKKFLEQYSSAIPEELKQQFAFIHKVHNSSSDEMNILEALVVWVRKVQKEFRFDLDALKMLEVIKFRLRVGLAINGALESTSQRMVSLVDKKNSLTERLSKINKELSYLEKPIVGVSQSPKEVSEKVKTLKAERTAINSALSKIPEEMDHQKISKNLIGSVEKLSESDSAVEMPLVVCETQAEKALVDKIQKSIKRHNKRVESFSLRKSPVMNSSTESETAELPVESEEVSPEALEEQAFFESTFRMRAKRVSDAKFGLESPLPLAFSVKDTESSLSDVEEQEAEPVKVWGIGTQKVESESKKIMQTISEKKEQLSILRNTNVEYARSVETLKTQMFRSIPEVIKSKTVKSLTTVDQNYQQYKSSQHQDGKESAIKEAAMTWWDRFCEIFRFTLSKRHFARKVEVQKYFQSLDARAQLETGLQEQNDDKIASSLNTLNVPDNYFNLWGSICKYKNTLSANTVVINKLSAEIKEQQERLREVQAEQKKQMEGEVDVEEEQEGSSPVAKPETVFGF